MVVAFLLKVRYLIFLHGRIHIYIISIEMARVFEYSYTTVPKSDIDEHNIFSTQARMNMQQGVGGPIAGLGFGLPMSKIYARYFGGSLELKSINGHGLDVFLRVPNITLKDMTQRVII
jgi:signal transduction histidine kinase